MYAITERKLLDAADRLSSDRRNKSVSAGAAAVDGAIFVNVSVIVVPDGSVDVASLKSIDPEYDPLAGNDTAAAADGALKTLVTENALGAEVGGTMTLGIGMGPNDVAEPPPPPHAVREATAMPNKMK